MTDKTLVTIEQKQVAFYDDEITVVLVDNGDSREVYVPIRQMCDLLGVSYQGQMRRINDDPVLSRYVQKVSVVFTTTASGGGGAQATNCLPLDYLNGWLFGINVKRVKEDVRERLIVYQEKCYRVLADSFLVATSSVQSIDSDEQSLMQLHNMALLIASTTKEMLEVRRLSLNNETRLDAAREYLRGMNNRLKVVEKRTQSGSLTEEQAREVQYRVNLIAQELTVHDPSVKHFGGVYEALRQETMSTSYKSIPMRGYESALSFLDNWLMAIQQASPQIESKDE